MTAGAAVAFVLGYLIGSVDFAVLVARARGGDIYQMGSGNPGAANVLRNLGWRAALPVMLGDMAKGAGAAALGLWLGGSDPRDGPPASPPSSATASRCGTASEAGRESPPPSAWH